MSTALVGHPFGDAGRTPYQRTDAETGVTVAKLAPERRTADGSCNAMEQKHVKALLRMAGSVRSRAEVVKGSIEMVIELTDGRNEMRYVQTLANQGNHRVLAGTSVVRVPLRTLVHVPSAGLDMQSACDGERGGDRGTRAVAVRFSEV